MILRVKKKLAGAIDELVIRFLLRPNVIKRFNRQLLERYVIFGEEHLLTIAQTAIVNNALFNTMSGAITVGEHVFFGHNVTLLTGTHDQTAVGPVRQESIPQAGRDIAIGEGAWIATNATIIGPARIGEHAVVGAGAVVLGDVDPFTLVVGVPARPVRRFDSGASLEAAPALQPRDRVS